MIEEYCPLIASLRPPIDRATVEQIFPEEITKILARAVGPARFEYGRDAKRAHDCVDRSGILQAITFRTSFPTQFEWYGLRPGMSLGDAGAALSTLHAETRLLPQQTEPNPRVQRMWGKAGDGIEVCANFIDNVLQELLIAEPGYRSALDEIERVDGFTQEARRSRRLNELQLQNRWRSIFDDDDCMLTTWATHIWPNNPEWSDEFVKFAAWFICASPDEWHRAVLSWNWDYGIAPLLWVIRHRDCELATVLHIFFGASPDIEDMSENRRDWVAAEYAVDLETFDLRMEIRERVAKDQYRSNTIAFDYSREVAAIGCHADDRLQRILPKGFISKQSGRILERLTWGKGLPPFNLS